MEMVQGEEERDGNFQEFLQPELSPYITCGRALLFSGTAKGAGMGNGLLSALALQSRYSNILQSSQILLSRLALICWKIPGNCVPCPTSLVIPTRISNLRPPPCCTVGSAVAWILQ